MELHQYVLASADTAKVFPGLTLSGSDSNLLHAALGVAGEVGELQQGVTENDTVNIAEELGDIAFYLAMATRTLQVPETSLARVQEQALHFGDVIPNVRASLPSADFSLNAVTQLVVWSSDFVDFFKKVLIYNKTLDTAKARDLTLTGWFYWGATCVACNVDPFAAVLPGNREKLAGKNGRYKDGYSDEAALNRDVTAEQSVLRATFGGSANEKPQTE